jgi:signal peptidase I
MDNCINNLKFYLCSLQLLEEQIAGGKRVCLEANGKCMSPIINKGEKLFAKKANPKDLKIGDIIVYKFQGVPIAHRIIYRFKNNSQTTFLTKGDMYFKIDAPVNENQIIGKVVAVKKTGKMLILDKPSLKFINYLISLLSILSIGMYKITSMLRRIVFLGRRPAWFNLYSKAFWRTFYLASELVKYLSRKKNYGL